MLKRIRTWLARERALIGAWAAMSASDANAEEIRIIRDCFRATYDGKHYIRIDFKASGTERSADIIPFRRPG